MKRVAVGGRKRLVRIWRVHHSNWSVRPGNELVRLRWLATPSPLKEEETAAEDERFQEVIILIGELTFFFFFFFQKTKLRKTPPSSFYFWSH